MAFSPLEKAMALLIGLDITAPGTTRKIAMKALTVLATRVAPVTVPAAAALGPVLPAAIGVGLGYTALQTETGQQLLEAAAERGRQDRIRFQSFIESERAQEALQRGRDLGTIGSPFQIDYSRGRSFGVLPTQKRKKRPSKFNQAVKAGMAAVKKSTSYGKKGKIASATKAFSVVVKLAAAKKKKKKAPKSGIKRKIWNAMRGI